MFLFLQISTAETMGKLSKLNTFQGGNTINILHIMDQMMVLTVLL